MNNVRNKKNCSAGRRKPFLIVWPLLFLLPGGQIEASDTVGYSPYANRDFPENLYWGDTHVHTNRSTDAYMFGNRYSSEYAYRFARGETVITQGGQPVRISQPLDFLVVSDHAEYLGYTTLLETMDPAFLATGLGKRLAGYPPEEAFRILGTEWGTIVNGLGPSVPQDDDPAMRLEVWRTVAAEADHYNDPGRFTAFIGYEWSSLPDVANLHRVVVYRDDQKKAGLVKPFSAADSRNPEDLWTYLQDYEDRTGGKVLAIPHNSNMSKGLMFSDRTFDRGPMTKSYAVVRSRWEPITEATQMKGDSETHPLLSPEDLFADYETWSSFTLVDDDSPRGKHMEKMEESDPYLLQGDYVRSGLKRGLALERQLGANPFKLGMIGSSDTHTSMSTVDENSFYSKTPFEDPSPDRSTREQGMFVTRDYAASGLAAVWAQENTRESIFDAMQRRETYATTGPRIVLRFFGGWDFETLDADRPDYAAIGYDKGVPMGGDLTAAPEGRSPRFLIVAAKDPMGANLERVQVVKGWLNSEGETREKVWDVVLSDYRKPGKTMASPITSTVDIKTATYTNTVGEAEMATVWEDPDFDPQQRAFYYVRVLEIPTPRWTTYDAAFYDTALPDDVPAEQQERAYSSPIWYTP